MTEDELTPDAMRRYLRTKGWTCPDGIWKWMEDGLWFEDVNCEADLDALFSHLPPTTNLVERRRPGNSRYDSEYGLATQRDPSEEIGDLAEGDRGTPTQVGDAARSRALALALAYDAWQRRDVQQFRRTALGNRVLSWGEADQFGASPVLAAFSLKDLRSWDVPLLDHVATLENEPILEEGKPITIRSMWRVDPPGITCEEIDIHDADTGEPLDGMEYLLTPGHQRTQTHGVKPRSVLWDLRQLALALCECYPWEEEQAVWVILTNHYPLLPEPVQCSFEPIRMNDQVHYGLISLKVAPWVSPEKVAEAYRTKQRQVVGHRIRPISDRRLQVLQMVLSYSPPTKRYDWPALFTWWNRSQGGDGGGFCDKAGLFKAFNAAWKELLKPDYTPDPPSVGDGKANEKAKWPE